MTRNIVYASGRGKESASSHPNLMMRVEGIYSEDSKQYSATILCNVRTEGEARALAKTRGVKPQRVVDLGPTDLSKGLIDFSYK